MAEITPEKAGQIVDDIRHRNGGITDEERAATPVGVLEALENVHRQLSMFLVSKDSSITGNTNTEFVYDLIASTERFHYSRVTPEIEPFLEFAVLSDRIVVDSNDDGCTEGDVRILCDIEHSVSRGVNWIQGKFLKNAFHIAWKVHIQSGPFSFAFQRPGLMTPFNEAKESLPENVRTRITLFLYRPELSADIAKGISGILLKGFMMFQPRCSNFFLKLNPPHEAPSRIHHQIQLNEDIMSWSTDTSKGMSYKRFLVHKYPPIFHSVYLCFPIDEESKPSLSTEDVYHLSGSCGIPLGSVGFNFAICWAFEFRGNGQKAFFAKGILDVIPDAVYHAFTGNALRKSMKYCWVQYIPNTNIASRLWRDMFKRLCERLRECKIFITEKGSQKDLPSLRYLLPSHCTNDNKPLFDDLDQDVYLSTQYTQYLDYLKSLGLQVISNHELLERFRPCMNGIAPRYQICTKNDHWHTCVARLLISWLTTTSDPTLIAKVRDLPLLPLLKEPFGTNLVSQGQHTNSITQKVYFPIDTDGNAIPTCVLSHVITPEAVRIMERKEVFHLLGVEYPDRKVVMDMIVAFNHRISCRVPVTDSVKILKYMYKTRLTGANGKCPCLLLLDQAMTPFRRNCTLFNYETDDVYFQTEGAYGLKNILQKLKGSSYEKYVRFLHPDYYDSIETTTHGVSDPWIQWLEDVALIRQIPRLTNPQAPNRLSNFFEAIVSHCPDIILGIIKTHWKTYEKEMTPSVVSALKQAVVPTGAGDRRLDQTYIPLPQLRRISNQVLGLGYRFPYLAEPENWGPYIEKEACFLGIFGSTGNVTVPFLKEIVAEATGMTPSDRKRVFFSLYEVMKDNWSEEIRVFLNTEAAVYIPAGSKEGLLVKLEKCMWNGPPWLHASYALASFSEYSQNAKVKHLFQTLLGVRDADLQTYLDDLVFLKLTSAGSLEQIYNVYKAILHDAKGDEDWKSLRNQFDNYGLLYEPASKKWYSPKGCIWIATSVGEKIGISEIYPDLKKFFIKMGVQRPSMNIYISQIEYLSTQDNIPADMVIEAIRHISKYKPIESALESLRDVKLLPIVTPDGNLHYGSTRDDFLIIDRDGWPLLFREKAPTLQLTPKEAQELRPFLEALGLSGRFVSTAATSKTSVVCAVFSPDLTREFQQKATVLCRCAVHYVGATNNEATQKLHRISRYATVYTSDDITEVRSLQLPSGLITSIKTPGRLHMDYSTGHLQVVVPCDINERHISYSKHLPEALIESLSINHPAACGTFAMVLREQVEVSSSVLLEGSIPELSELALMKLENTETEPCDDEISSRLASLMAAHSLDLSKVSDSLGGSLFSGGTTPGRLFATEASKSDSHKDYGASSLLKDEGSADENRTHELFVTAPSSFTEPGESREFCIESDPTPTSGIDRFQRSLARVNWGHGGSVLESDEGEN
ncbi:hypothetical protein BDV23DRAFT_163869, partial [Aspergillus alliaceus]